MSRGTAAFLDTTIQIARVVHSPETKQRIAARLAGFDISVTSDVVRQEFKRRLLKEAQYLLNQLNKQQSYTKVLRHVTDFLPPQQGRKRNISLELLETVLEGATDDELTERARRYLRTLLRVGLADFVVGRAGGGLTRGPVAARSIRSTRTRRTVRHVALLAVRQPTPVLSAVH